MRAIALLAVLALLGCAQETPLAGSSQAELWQRANGSILSPKEVRRAYLQCQARLQYEPQRLETPYFEQPGGSMNFYSRFWDSPAYGRLSSAEFGACMHANGYSRVAELPTGYGSSAPAAR